MPLKLVRDIIAYVPQETFLFKQTIDENIAFSDSTLSSELIAEAATYSGVAKDINEFKDGYNTISAIFVVFNKIFSLGIVFATPFNSARARLTLLNC